MESSYSPSSSAFTAFLFAIEAFDLALVLLLTGVESFSGSGSNWSGGCFL
jgi:hypothetical protein